MRTSSIILCIVTMLVGIISSCNDNVPYFHYEKISDEGWDVRDTVVFGVDTIKQDGTYTSSVCVRATALYPYSNLSLMVYQTVFKKTLKATSSDGKPKVQNKGYKKSRTIVYTMPLEIKQENGIATGQGVTYYTYENPFANIYLQQGDSVAIVVRHHMRREILPGITDIGIKLCLTP